MMSLTEVGLRAVGTALAALSMAFAVYMLAYGDHRPHIYGMEYLGIFAQPRGPLHSAKSGEPPLVLPTVDMTTTGSFTPAPEPAPPRPPEMIAARPDRAWVRIEGAIHAVAPGDDVPGIGHVAGIVEGATEWTLADEKGLTLLTLKKDANGAAMFARRMILQ